MLSNYGKQKGGGDATNGVKQCAHILSAVAAYKVNNRKHMKY